MLVGSLIPPAKRGGRPRTVAPWFLSDTSDTALRNDFKMPVPRYLPVPETRLLLERLQGAASPLCLDLQVALVVNPARHPVRAGFFFALQFRSTFSISAGLSSARSQEPPSLIGPLEADRTRTFVEHRATEFVEPLFSGGDGQEVVAGELTRLAREAHGSVSQQDLGLADAARVEDNLPRRGIARCVAEASPEFAMARAAAAATIKAIPPPASLFSSWRRADCGGRGTC